MKLLKTLIATVLAFSSVSAFANYGAHVTYNALVDEANADLMATHSDQMARQYKPLLTRYAAKGAEPFNILYQNGVVASGFVSDAELKPKVLDIMRRTGMVDGTTDGETLQALLTTGIKAFRDGQAGAPEPELHELLFKDDLDRQNAAAAAKADGVMTCKVTRELPLTPEELNSDKDVPPRTESVPDGMINLGKDKTVVSIKFDLEKPIKELKTYDMPPMAADGRAMNEDSFGFIETEVKKGKPLYNVHLGSTGSYSVFVFHDCKKG